MTEYLGEFIGTLLLILFGAGVVAGSVLKGTKSENNGWLIICLAWGAGVAFAVYAVGSVSGAHLNWAVTIGLAAAGQFPWTRVPGYLLAQLAGAFTGAVIVWLHYLPHWKGTPDVNAKLGIFSTIPAIRHYPSNLISEIIGTFVLMFGLEILGVNKFSDGLNPLVIGGLIATIGFSLGGTTGFAINPARDLGPRLAHFLLPIPGKGGSDWRYAWIPIVGPLIGGITGTLCFKALFRHEVNPALWIMAFIIVIIAGMALRSKNRINTN
jgi:glycerol uptake facilitator protein